MSRFAIPAIAATLFSVTGCDNSYDERQLELEAEAIAAEEFAADDEFTAVNDTDDAFEAEFDDFLLEDEVADVPAEEFEGGDAQGMGFDELQSEVETSEGYYCRMERKRCRNVVRGIGTLYQLQVCYINGSPFTWKWRRIGSRCYAG